MDLTDEHFADHIFFIAQDATGIDFEPDTGVCCGFQFGIQVVENFGPGASLRCQGGYFDDRRFGYCNTTRGY
jgi:hypothetical protein